jgi:cytochrome c5
MSQTSTSEHDQHSSFIKTPQQLIVVILLSFLVPIIGIILLVQLVVGTPSADPGALEPEKVAARVQPVGKVEIGAPAAAPGARSGEEIVKSVCAACHQAGVANAPKIGDSARWGQLAKEGMPSLLATATKGKGAMPPKGGAADLTDTELARAIAYMANQSGQNLKPPATKPEQAAKPGAAAKK